VPADQREPQCATLLWQFHKTAPEQRPSRVMAAEPVPNASAVVLAAAATMGAATAVLPTVAAAEAVVVASVALIANAAHAAT
jgi:hypothetical protein